LGCIEEVEEARAALRFAALEREAGTRDQQLVRFAHGAAIEVVAPARMRSDPFSPRMSRTSRLVGIPTVGFIATVAITAGSSQSTADPDAGIYARDGARPGPARQTGRPMSLSETEREQLLDSWPVARLATVAASGRPQLVPIVFARARVAHCGRRSTAS